MSCDNALLTYVCMTPGTFMCQTKAELETKIKPQTSYSTTQTATAALNSCPQSDQQSRAELEVSLKKKNSSIEKVTFFGLTEDTTPSAPCASIRFSQSAAVKTFGATLALPIPVLQLMRTTYAVIAMPTSCQTQGLLGERKPTRTNLH
ncbi:hypothetical protein WMY93_016560 [Mugilogobius chulae]|uniref:Uncharacterized protein n=1 Tax=Mugilogobius chulae TaxID=88201 RepID=A0AAW0NLY1_9GOBI